MESITDWIRKTEFKTSYSSWGIRWWASIDNFEKYKDQRSIAQTRVNRLVSEYPSRAYLIRCLEVSLSKIYAETMNIRIRAWFVTLLCSSFCCAHRLWSNCKSRTRFGKIKQLVQGSCFIPVYSAGIKAPVPEIDGQVNSSTWCATERFIFVFLSQTGPIVLITMCCLN